MRTWIGALVMGVAGLWATPGKAQTPTCADSARTVLAALPRDSTRTDSVRTIARAMEACACGAQHGLPPDSSCQALYKALPQWALRADSLPEGKAWPFFHALGDWELANGHAPKALDAFADAMQRSPADSAVDARLLQDLIGRATAFLALHRYDSAYAAQVRIMDVRDHLNAKQHDLALDSLRGALNSDVANIADTLRTVRKQALLDQRLADRRAQWMLYGLIGLAALAVLFLVLFLVRKKKPARIVTVQGPATKATAPAPAVAAAPAPAPTPVPAPTPAAPAPARPAPPTSTNRISAGIFSAEEFTADLERVTMMIREGRSVDAMGWAQAMGKLGRTLMDRPEESTVADELAVVRHYLKVEAMRWPDTHFEVTADRALTDADVRIPSLSALPFVQAAMRLGAGRAEGERLLIVHFQGSTGGVQCIISSNGPGWAAEAAGGDSAASDLREARKRFERYGTCTINDLPEAEGVGTRVLLTYRADRPITA